MLLKCPLESIPKDKFHKTSKGYMDCILLPHITCIIWSSCMYMKFEGVLNLTLLFNFLSHSCHQLAEEQAWTKCAAELNCSLLSIGLAISMGLGTLSIGHLGNKCWGLLLHNMKFGGIRIQLVVTTRNSSFTSCLVRKLAWTLHYMWLQWHCELLGLETSVNFHYMWLQSHCELH
jgi:hypothetical protein